MSAVTDRIHPLADHQGMHGSDEQAMQRQHCEQAWKRALQNGDREALRALRLHIADAAAGARHRPGGREQWLAWMLLRCALLLPRRRF